MKIKFVDLKRQLFGDSFLGTKGIYDEIDIAMKKVINNTSFILGEDLEKFEKDFAEYCGTKYCVGLNSGTDALEFLLIANGIISGEVITVPNTYFTTVSSISNVGATPVLVDVDPWSYNINVSKIEQVITNRTKAIIPVHLYGRPCDMDKIIDIAKKYNLKIIEDCCQAHGAEYKGKKVPISGTGAFSFFPGKNLGCFGDGGALVTNDFEVYKKALLLRNDGSIKKYSHEILGRKARLHTLQAAILSVKLKHLDEWNKKRKTNAELYNRLLRGISSIQLPLDNNSEIQSVFHVYQIITNKRDELLAFLNQNGIETNIHYPVPIPLQPAYQNYGFGNFSVSERLAKQTLSLPMFPELREDEINYVSDKIKEFFETYH